MADNPIWAIMGVPCRDEWEQEGKDTHSETQTTINVLIFLVCGTAGQILVDKKIHLDALLLAEFMMDSSRFKYWFKYESSLFTLITFGY